MARQDHRKKRPMVVGRQGRYRFQTGMVTAHLLKRGLPAAVAFSLSRQLREAVTGRGEVTTDELRAEIDRLLVEVGYDSLVDSEATLDGEPMRADGSAGPVTFPQHILLRDLVAIGMEPDQAVDVERALQLELRSTESLAVQTSEVDLVLGRLLMGAGRPYYHRYKLVEWLRASERPVVIFIGGATGTGKSTLAMDLAFRLGIRMVVSTDMIRETMRTVLSAEVVPGLHDHSFRGMLQGGQVLSDPQERVLAGFRQQSAQVAAGIRAVIRRALRENTHMIVEGTHLLPPFLQYLPSEDVNHAGLMLAVPAEAEHRARFPRRQRAQKLRDATAYLEAFQSVRWIHDDLLTTADESEALVLTSSALKETSTATFDYLADVLPQEGAQNVRARRVLPDIRTLFLIMDGLSDEAHDALDGRTPLQAADTPTLEMLAEVGGQGQILTAPEEGAIPHTDEGLWSLIGLNPPRTRLGRGVIEAMGQGVPLTPGAVVLRGNLATRLDDGSLVDRRAGRINAGQEDLIAGLRDVPLSGGLRGSVFPGLEHRVVVMIRGAGLSAEVSDTDPGSGATTQRVLEASPLDDSPEAARTATALRELLELAASHLGQHPHNLDRVARGLLSANCVITRGAASTSGLPEVQHSPKDAALVAACSTALGVARMAGMQAVTGPGMTGTLDTDLDAKFEAAASLLETRSLVVIHCKGTDIAAHDRRPLAKRDFISAVDAALGRFLESYGQVTTGIRVVVSADHGTSSRTGNHIADPVPVLVATWQGLGERSEFDEESAERGALGVLRPGELAQMLWAG